jgi:dipeptidyl aminopeptidase/acylaminoacyl peptidase
VWSPDGKSIAYVTWNEEGGDIWRIAPEGGRPQKLTTQSAFYDDIAWSPNGARLVAARAPRTQRAFINDEINPALVITDLVWLSATGGAATYITSLTNASRPHFSSDTNRVWSTIPYGLVSMRWDGTDRKAHLKVTGYQAPGGGPNAQPRQAQELQVSPDGNRVLAQVDNKLRVPLPVTGGTTPTVSVNQPTGGPLPFRRLSRIGGEFLGWNQDSRGVFYSLGRSFFRYNLALADSLAADSAAKAPPARGEARTPAVVVANRPVYEPARSDITITAAKDRPSGSVVLRGARIITMKGSEVIERGTSW